MGLTRTITGVIESLLDWFAACRCEMMNGGSSPPRVGGGDCCV